jgi:Uma2 family endonuclease
MAAICAPMTIEEFERSGLPENYELHHGEPVAMTLPVLEHREIQDTIRDLLKQAFPHAHVLIEYTFEVAGTNDKRSADMGMTTLQRRKDSGRGALIGAPELVVEVLSPSNSVLKLNDYRRLCFQNGTHVFLTVDSDAKTVEMHLKGVRTAQTWTVGEEIPVELWGERRGLAVDAIFAEAG